MSGMGRTRILIVENDTLVRETVRDFLADRGYEVEEADSVASGERVFRDSQPDAAVCDYALNDGNALQLLPRLRAIDPQLPVVILTGHASVDLAVQAIQAGADHFLTKPVELSSLAIILERLIDNQRSRKHVLAGKARGAQRKVDPFVGKSDAIRQLEADVRRVMVGESPIVIQGETGTGKGVLASWMHENGPRSDETFVDLNCAGLQREFLETELFGHQKGAFTGAIASKLGLLDVAHRGTVFLDEIGDVDLDLQPKLLKVLEEKRFRRLGDTRDRVVDIRLIAATHQDLAALVRTKRFRSDLYFRICAIPLRVPALRERREDIPDVARRLLTNICTEQGRPVVELSDAALATLVSYAWPGNVREMRNVLDRALLLSDSDTLQLRDLHFQGVALEPLEDDELGMTLMEVERRHIERVLDHFEGRVVDAARSLGVPRSTLYQRVKNLGIVLRRS